MMRFSVEGWDPGYGSAVEIAQLPETSASVDAAIETPVENWRPVPAGSDLDLPRSVLFVDGVRRIEARVWIEDDAPDGGGGGPGQVAAGICASYAAGVVCCCADGAHALGTQVRRRLFTAATTATHVPAGVETFVLHRIVADPAVPAAVNLTLALQRALVDLEITVAVEARAAVARHRVDDDNLLVIDGPLRGRAHLPRAVGYIKTHHAEYLPPELNSVVAQLLPGERTPIFAIGSGWERYSWYLRLPCLPAGPWAGIVRIEAAPTLDVSEVVTLAGITQRLLGRFASVEYKDGRAPQNLVPIAGLEKNLRHRLGHAPLLYRAIKGSAHSSSSFP